MEVAAKMSREEKRRDNHFVLFLFLMAFFICGCTVSPDSGTGSILDGDPVLTAGMPDVVYYKTRAVDVVLQAAADHGAGDPLYFRAVSILQALRGGAGTARSITGTATNGYQPTAEDVQVMDAFLSNVPAVAVAMSNTMYEFTNLMQQSLQNQPLTIDVLTDPPDMTVCSPARNSIPDEVVEYSYTVYPGEDGSYDTGAGDVSGIELLEADQLEARAGSAARGFVITKDSLLKASLGGGAWPDGVVPYYWSSGFRWSGSCPRKAAVKAQMEAITSLMTNAQGERKVFFRDLGFFYSVYMSWAWALCLSRTLCIYVDDKMEASGSGGVGYGYRRRLRYKSSILEDPVNNRYTLQHELCHVLGLKHEHQRDDRDRYVRVRRKTGYSEQNHGRIRWKYKFLFKTYFRSSNYDTPYDYNSIMHYPVSGVIEDIINENHRTRGEEVFTVNPTKYFSLNGGTFLSPYDIYTVKRHYGILPNPKPSYTPGMD